MPSLRITQQLDARLRDLPSAEGLTIITRVAAIDEFKGWWNGAGISLAGTPRRLATTALLSARASTRIAGRNERPADPHRRGFPTRSVAEERTQAQVRAYADLLRLIFANHAAMTFGEPLILQLHQRALQDAPGDSAFRGRYKAVAPVTVTAGRRTTESLALRAADPDLTPRLMGAAIGWTCNRLTARDFHPLLVIAAFILEFLAIRPFADGNGRVSRLLTNLLLLQSGYSYMPYVSLEQVIAEHWADYYVGLRHSQANANRPHPDISAWIHAFLDVLQLQIKQLHGAIEHDHASRRLSPNQLAVLQLLEREKEVTNRHICQELRLSRNTSKQVLGCLVALRLLRRVGAGRSVRYLPVSSQDGDKAAR